MSFNVVNQDVDAFNGLKSFWSYGTTRSEATTEALQQAYQVMLTQQQNEAEKQSLFKAADAVRLAESDFHNAVLAMKEVVRRFGLDSDQAQAVGLKKKSERKRPSKQKALTK